MDHDHLDYWDYWGEFFSLVGDLFKDPPPAWVFLQLLFWVIWLFSAGLFYYRNMRNSGFFATTAYVIAVIVIPGAVYKSFFVGG